VRGSFATVEKTNKVFWTGAAILSLITVAVFHFSPQVPLGIAWDEPTKVQDVLENTQNFQHPILMLQIVRLANLFVGASEPVGVLWLGRAAAAVSGGLLVFAVTALARRAVGDSAALGAGVLTAVAPLSVLHAQLFKEDIFVAPWLVLGVLALDHLRETPAFRQAVLFGVAAGLAAAAKYVGIVLVFLSLLLPVWAKTRTRCYYRMVVVAIIAAAAVFCVVNLPLFGAPRAFLSGLSSGVRHGLSGHDIVLYPWHSLFAFTWTADIWPGLHAPLALAGLLGAFIVVIRWHVTPPVLRHLLVFGLAWYLMHELSPTKPFPEGARYMTVMPAVFAVFAAFAAERFAAWLSAPYQTIVASGLIAGMAVIPAATSFELTRSAPHDTGLVVQRIAANLDGPIAWEEFPDRARVVFSSQLTAESAQFVVINELWAKRSVYSLSLPGQGVEGRRRGAAYKALLTHPALLVTSRAGSYAFRNVPYRIIALKGNFQELTGTARRFAMVPTIHLQVVNQGLTKWP
jgi:4-amino-4-deoxy-L-arabinose transferase-like glycosyltransferase